MPPSYVIIILLTCQVLLERTSRKMLANLSQFFGDLRIVFGLIQNTSSLLALHLLFEQWVVFYVFLLWALYLYSFFPFKSNFGLCNQWVLGCCMVLLLAKQCFQLLFECYFMFLQFIIANHISLHNVVKSAQRNGSVEELWVLPVSNLLELIELQPYEELLGLEKQKKNSLDALGLEYESIIVGDLWHVAEAQPNVCFSWGERGYSYLCNKIFLFCPSYHLVFKSLGTYLIGAKPETATNHIISLSSAGGFSFCSFALVFGHWVLCLPSLKPKIALMTRTGVIGPTS